MRKEIIAIWRKPWFLGVLTIVAVLILLKTFSWESQYVAEESLNLNITPEILVTLDMDDKRLINYIREFVLEPPAPRNVPYNLVNPNQIHYSQEPAVQSKPIGEYFKQKRNGTFFEAGAFDGEWLSNSLYFEKSLDWTGILMEPAGKKTQDRLRKKRRRAYFLPNCLAGAKPVRVHFDGIDGTGSTVKKINISLSENSSEANVWCFPVYSIFMAAQFPRIDYFVLDLEGFEMDVVPYIPFDKLQIKLIQIETNTAEYGKRVRQYFQNSWPQYEELVIPSIKGDVLFVHKTLPL